MPRFPKISLLLLTGITAVLRTRSLFANAFLPDEALFATWAREIAIWRDPLLQLQPIDKPPLLFYFQALFYPMFGPVAFAARWPNWISSLLLVPLVGLLAWKLYRRPGTAVVAAALVALFPLTIQFSGTAFTDPLLALWLMASLTAVAMGKRKLSGLFVALALTTKYQAILFLPLLAGLGWLMKWHKKEWLSWVGAVLPPAAGWLLWEWARSGSFLLWQNQINNFGGLRVSRSWELWPRFQAWLEMWQTAVSPLIFIFVILAFAWLLFRHLRPQTHLLPTRPVHEKEKIDRLLLIFVLSYGLFHWLLAVPVWDRYLLPVMPLLALLLARAYGALWAQLPGGAPVLQLRAAWLILVLMLISFSWPARNGRYALGSFPQADQGAAAVAVALNDAPYGTVLYDHWFSWQWRYHLFDSRVFVSWFPHADALVDDLKTFGQDGSPRYIALPDSTAAQPILRAVGVAGYGLTAVARSDQIVLYAITPQQTHAGNPRWRNGLFLRPGSRAHASL